MSLGEAVIRLEQERDAAVKELRGVRQALKNLEERTIGDLGILDPHKLAEAEAMPLLMWSTLRLPKGTCLAHGRFGTFDTALGCIGAGYERGLSRSETNLKEAGRIPSGLPSRIIAAGVEIRGGSDADVEMIRQHLVLDWEFTQVRMEIGPVNSPFFKWDQTGRRGACRLGVASSKSRVSPKPAPPVDQEKTGHEFGIEVEGLSTHGLTSRWNGDSGSSPSEASYGTEEGVLVSSGVRFSVGLVFGASAPIDIDQEMTIRVSLAYEHRSVDIG